MSFTKQKVGYTGYGVFNYPEGLEGWTLGRFEYGGHAEDCIKECNMWLPPTLDPYKIVDLINESQKGAV